MTVPYNTAADDKSGWTVGDTGKITGYSFDGWYTSLDGRRQVRLVHEAHQ